ncbi:exported hypothetical protein [Vibrio nigripulchritudo SOn1]|uniref:Uncharacterized protein n=1 Tax=Vibrio nigripulchritudo SOn1 TaxID=1238450 RepID=A0AAV2VHT8_9VIBR|nr:heparin lyase I family protein [Vibrio nigripulchritudo]CCO44217.1 exported hypothetical protein [Vibrio nigripulchritudo SOn1]
MNKVKMVSVIAISGCLSFSALAKTPVNNIWKELYGTMSFQLSETLQHLDNGKVHVECSLDNIAVVKRRYETVIQTIMNNYVSGRKRCELATTAQRIARDKPFNLEFKLKLSSKLSDSRQWFSAFQFHSNPDKGENWRCPILALESVQGNFRMYNRWDENRISTTKNGTCGNAGNSIQYRKLFEDLNYNAEDWIPVKISGVLSYSNPEACLSVSVGGVEMSYVCGLNTFNDGKPVYAKFGIYKPTSWDTAEREITAEYKDIRFSQ